MKYNTAITTIEPITLCICANDWRKVIFIFNTKRQAILTRRTTSTCYRLWLYPAVLLILRPAATNHSLNGPQESWNVSRTELHVHQSSRDRFIHSGQASSACFPVSSTVTYTSNQRHCRFINRELKLFYLRVLSVNTEPTCRQRLWSYEMVLHKFNHDYYYRNEVIGSSVWIAWPILTTPSVL